MRNPNLQTFLFWISKRKKKIIKTNLKQLQKKKQEHQNISIQLLLSKTLDTDNEDNSSDTPTVPEAEESPNDFFMSS